MLHLEHINYFIILVILKGTQFGSVVWSEVCMRQFGALLFMVGSFIFSAGPGIFSSPMCCPPQLLLVISTENPDKGLLGTSLVQSSLWSGKMELSRRAA